jgi:hypothetical protein
MESYRHVSNDAAVRDYQNLMTLVRSSSSLSASLPASGGTKRVGHSTCSSSMATIQSWFGLSVGASALTSSILMLPITMEPGHLVIC